LRRRPRIVRRKILQQTVRIRLQFAADLVRPPRTLLDHPQADVRRDPVQPGRQRPPWLEPLDRAPRAEHGLLHRVVGICSDPSMR
jgi:hypothetical protein